jgi:hypothetical protein
MAATKCGSKGRNLADNAPTHGSSIWSAGLQVIRVGPGAVGIEFSQVGKDQGAQRFLATLDKDPEVGKIIDATSYYVCTLPDPYMQKFAISSMCTSQSC